MSRESELLTATRESIIIVIDGNFRDAGFVLYGVVRVKDVFSARGMYLLMSYFLFRWRKHRFVRRCEYVYMK